MADKSITIIGAGMSGLSAGCYGQMNGYRTRIFEMHDKPGGLCTAWKRQGYTITTPGWLMGSGPANNDFYRFWEELGALQGRTIVDFEEFGRIEGRDGQVLILYTDIDRLEQHMVELAPEDEAAIAEFILVLRTLTQFKAPMDLAPELAGPPPAFEMPPYMMKYMGMPLGAFADEFKNPFLREALGEALSEIFFSCPDASMAMVLNTFAQMHLKAAGYPVGGFLKLVRAIERRYLNLGGEIHYDSRVVKALVEDDRAVGVRLEDGIEHRSDIVISAADGRTTIFDMLRGKYINDEIRGYYDTLPLYPPILLISLGVDRTFEKRPPSVVGTVFPLDEPLTIAGREYEWLVPHRADFDPALAPEGKTLLKVTLASDYAYWKDLREHDRRGYKDEQEEIEDQVIALLDQRYPGLASQVEMVDVATPVSFERYTGCWQGSWLGWAGTPESMSLHISKTLPGLGGFYMVGTWVMNSSLPFAATSGRHITQIMCHEDGKPFVTTVP